MKHNCYDVQVKFHFVPFSLQWYFSSPVVVILSVRTSLTTTQIKDLQQYDKAQAYFDSVLNTSNPTDEEIACLFFNFGRTHRTKGDFPRVIRCYNRAYELHTNGRPKRRLVREKL